MQRCADCHHVYDERDDDERASGESPIYRCGKSVPFWVPLPVYDYGSWVTADDGAKCATFQPKPM